MTGRDPDWFAPALALARASRSEAGHDAFGFLDVARPIVVTRAPGRLDVMGGIADYSGSLVLEMPLACATHAIAQAQDAPRLDVVSVRADGTSRFSLTLEELLGDLRDPDTLAAWFTERPGLQWAAYVVGSVYRCLTTARRVDTARGLRLLIRSDVPEGMGVSSSAALEVAVMTATATCFDVPMDGMALAAACQWAENHIARAPCGIMDQMASALGMQDRLLRLRCQPAIVEGYVDIPHGYRCYGIDSGIRHAVSGADYGTVRTAAFMGYRMIAEMEGMPAASAGGPVHVEDDRWRGYLANVGPATFAARFAEALPERMHGAEFLARYGGITDAVTRVHADRWYPVRQATAHPVFEHTRVIAFAALLDTGLANRADAERAGALMLDSHASYGACGLGSEGTDRLVELAMELGPARGLFGAKITGGGSGGTVAILGAADALPSVRAVARRYEADTDRPTTVFDASGPGALELGALTLPAGAW